MAPWIFVAVSVLLLGATLRMWLEYGQRQRQLVAELHRLRGLIKAHSQRVETVRTITQNIERETKTLIERRTELQTRVLEDRTKLTEMEEHLERVRPKSHRIDNSSRQDKGDW
ncbi:MAG: hypothetical protein O2782_14905 [bacterium]|nr:hypothetical protein [bacterium]